MSGLATCILHRLHAYVYQLGTNLKNVCSTLPGGFHVQTTASLRSTLVMQIFWNSVHESSKLCCQQQVTKASTHLTTAHIMQQQFSCSCKSQHVFLCEQVELLHVVSHHLNSSWQQPLVQTSIKHAVNRHVIHFRDFSILGWPFTIWQLVVCSA